MVDRPNIFLPVRELIGLSFISRVVACSLLVGTPILCASLCFSSLFEGQKNTGAPLGINLVGAMAGGMLEYFSMAHGMAAVARPWHRKSYELARNRVAPSALQVT